jgi:hypothetical protein
LNYEDGKPVSKAISNINKAGIVLWQCNVDPNINHSTYATQIGKENMRKDVWPNAREKALAP